jgi:hypothetical protein
VRTTPADANETGIPMCIEHARLLGEYEDAKREFLAAQNALMDEPLPAPRLLLRNAASAALKKREACRIALRVHELAHGCAAAHVSA